MKRVKLFIAAVLLPAAAVVTRRAEKDVSKFGPGACVSAWVGEGNRVIVETKCKEQPAFSAYALHLICVDQDGGRVLHSFEKGGFDPEEVFDTKIVCDKCEAGDLDQVPQVFLTKPKDGQQQDIDRLSEGQEGKDDSAWKSLGDTSLVTPDSGVERDTSFTPRRAPASAPAAIAGASPSPAPAVQPGLRIADTRITALEEEVAKLTDSTLQISEAMSSLRDKVMRKVNLKPAEKSESSSKSAERSVSEGSSSTSAERSVSEVEPSKEAPAAPEGSKKEVAGAALALSGAKLLPTQLAGMVGALSPVAVEKSKEILDSVQEAEKEAEQAAFEAEESEVRQQAPAATAQVPATSAAAVQPVVAATSAAAVQPVVMATSAAAVQPVVAATSAAAVQPVVAASARATAPPVQKTATMEQPQAMHAQPPTQQLKSTPVPPVTQAAVPASDAQSEGSVETEAEKQEDEDLAGLLVDSD